MVGVCSVAMEMAPSSTHDLRMKTVILFLQEHAEEGRDILKNGM